MVRVSIEEASERLDDLLDSVADARERVVIVEDGSVRAVLLGPDELAELDAARAVIDYLRREPNPVLRRE